MDEDSDEEDRVEVRDGRGTAYHQTPREGLDPVGRVVLRDEVECVRAGRLEE